jgi:NAD(P)-dependent dehydrogenase (short-subunit alcohol dehydrogenase family)
MKLDEAVVLVTGANRGLGRSLVEAFVRVGAKRVYATARDPKKIAAPSERVVPLSLDVDDARSIAEAADAARDTTLLVNNAGVLRSFKFLQTTREEIEKDFATNFFGPLATTRAFLPALERAKEAAVVNVLSVASLANPPVFAGYAASKAAAFSLTQALRAELAPKEIRVHGVFAGTIDTDMVKGYEMAKASPDVVAANIVEALAAGVEDIAPDPASRELFALWQRDPKAVERALAAMI